MLLIEIFTDHVVNKKSLKEYVEIRKSVKERGEFNDQSLIEAEDILQQLKKDNNKIYNLMYETLGEYIKSDNGHMVEYPINFIREILKINKKNMTAEKVYKNYKSGLKHHINDA